MLDGIWEAVQLEPCSTSEAECWKAIVFLYRTTKPLRCYLKSIKCCFIVALNTSVHRKVQDVESLNLSLQCIANAISFMNQKEWARVDDGVTKQTDFQLDLESWRKRKHSLHRLVFLIPQTLFSHQNFFQKLSFTGSVCKRLADCAQLDIPENNWLRVKTEYWPTTR